MLAALRAPDDPPCPRGMSDDTLAAVIRLLQNAPTELSGQVAEDMGVSRVTARRYLEHLTKQHLASAPHYGGAGQPNTTTPGSTSLWDGAVAQFHPMGG